MSPAKPYATTLAVCSVVLKKAGKYLLVQEKQPHVYGKWNLPGGRVDEGETLEQAAVREALEETNYNVEIVKQIFVHHSVIDQPVLHAYSAKIIGGKLKYPVDEILDARWFSHAEILAKATDLRNPEYIMGALAAAQKS